MATGGNKPWSRASFGTVTKVSGSGEVTVGFATNEETSDLKVGDAVVLVPLPSADQHYGGDGKKPKDS